VSNIVDSDVIVFGNEDGVYRPFRKLNYPCTPGARLLRRQMMHTNLVQAHNSIKQHFNKRIVGVNVSRLFNGFQCLILYQAIIVVFGIIKVSIIISHLFSINVCISYQ
jgi:hypothetical protein